MRLPPCCTECAVWAPWQSLRPPAALTAAHQAWRSTAPLPPAPFPSSQRPRCFRAEAVTTCELLAISTSALQRMQAEAPDVAAAVHTVLLRDACLNEIYALEVLERSALTS